MAIARGAGTEIIRSASFETVNATAQTLIVGVQHHIYTVLSITVYHASIAQQSGEYIQCLLKGFDATAAGSQQEIYIFNQAVQPIRNTFIWNDKFSFNGYEPTGISSVMNTAVEQDAIADQGGSAKQELIFSGTHASNHFDVHITYIDQNNA